MPGPNADGKEKKPSLSHTRLVLFTGLPAGGIFARAGESFMAVQGADSPRNNDHGKIATTTPVLAGDASSTAGDNNRWGILTGIAGGKTAAHSGRDVPTRCRQLRRSAVTR